MTPGTHPLPQQHTLKTAVPFWNIIALIKKKISVQPGKMRCIARNSLSVLTGTHQAMSPGYPNPQAGR